MSERSLFVTSWAAISLAMLAMVIGHAGAAPLNWEVNEISTYAAHAPHRDWVTSGMLLPCIALAAISVLISRHRILGDSVFAHLAPLLAGAAIGGLVTLAGFKEAAPSTAAALKTAGVAAVVQQSFHNAGLMGFFFSTVLLLLLCGALAVANASGRLRRLAGLSAIFFGLAALPLMEMPWPHLLGVSGPVTGLMQRASLFGLWLGAALILAAARPSLHAQPVRAQGASL
jgi:hypothetical protein